LIRNRRYKYAAFVVCEIFDTEYAPLTIFVYTHSYADCFLFEVRVTCRTFSGQVQYDVGLGKKTCLNTSYEASLGGIGHTRMRSHFILVTPPVLDDYLGLQSVVEPFDG
jgi:hypothetical protein